MAPDGVALGVIPPTGTPSSSMTKKPMFWQGENGRTAGSPPRTVARKLRGTGPRGGRGPTSAPRRRTAFFVRPHQPADSQGGGATAFAPSWCLRRVGAGRVDQLRERLPASGRV